MFNITMLLLRRLIFLQERPHFDAVLSIARCLFVCLFPNQVYELEFGFRTGEIQHMITEVPKMLTANKTKLCKIFHYIHNTMGIPHSLIAKFPQVNCFFWC